MSLQATPTETESLGFFRIFAHPPGGVRREITIFRNAPVILDNASTQDPFTEQTASITLKQVTVFDAPGEGDLDWLVANSNIDIIWQNMGSHDLSWSWEGYIASLQFSTSGSDMTFQVDLKGAFYGLDDYLAIPSFPKRPIPYEILIARAFDQKLHPARLGTFQMLFPRDWDLVVPEFNDPQYLAFLKPWGVATGQRWSGFTSRTTGSWEPLLTGHVQSLLSVMFAEGGAQWTIRNRGMRRPELHLRQIPEFNDPSIIEIHLGAPGVGFSGSKDYTQRASVIYGQGTDDAGISYSGMELSADGKTTFYKPFAYSQTVYPRKQNPSFNSRDRAKETMIRFQDGVDEASAIKIAQGQLQRFSEPGITGSVTLQTDPRYADGCLCPRLLIQAGATLRIFGLLGSTEGVLAHVTQTSADFNSLSMSLSFDTKYRDQLTVEEVKARTRDALTPLRSLQVGKYSNTVQDLILPWSYKEGSGCVPLGSKEFYQEKLPANATFPFEEWTRKHPPSHPASKNYYIRINPADTTDSDKNWCGVGRDGFQVMAIPIRMSQAGTIRLSQLAAYDKDGNVLKVRFHYSVYSNNGVTFEAMPSFPMDPDTDDVEVKYLKPVGGASYLAGQHNPFFEGAWETIDADGTEWDDDSYLAAQSLVVGWGNYYEPAGYSPGRFSRGATRTGLLEDESQWSWDLSETLDKVDPENNANEEYSGMLFVEIYCDDQGNQPVFFMGRFQRQEPGQS